MPATCPECGARIDQSTASFAEHPTCTYCAKPLPCEQVAAEAARSTIRQALQTWN